MVESYSKTSHAPGGSYLQAVLGNSKGMIVGELLPLLEFQDLITCNRTCKGFNHLITPTYSTAVRYDHLFTEQKIDLQDEELQDLANSRTLNEVTVVYHRATRSVRLMKSQKLGHSYTRFDAETRRKEYLSYAGGNESMWTGSS